LLLLAVVVLFVSEGAEAGPLELERLELKRVNSSWRRKKTLPSCAQLAGLTWRFRASEPCSWLFAITAVTKAKWKS